jgi:acetylornithine deacetylase/succinyl-diaminopimelate desuccinylase-like protein
MLRLSQKLSIIIIFLSSSAPASWAGQDWNAVGDETVRMFRDYLSIDTANPPGDVSVAADFYKRALEEAGASVELHWTDRENGKVNLVSRLKGSGSKRPLMLLNHFDTVPVDRSGWSVDPFSGIRKDGYIYGRGALDMKNFGIMQLMTMVLLSQNKVDLERDVVLVTVADEEMLGDLGARWVAENLWDDIDAEYVFDEGGFGTQGFFTNDDRLIFSVGVAEKKVLWLKLIARGTEGHGSMPPDDNANFILAKALSRLADYQTPEQIIPVVAEMKNRLGELVDTPYNNAIRRNTVSLTVLKAYVGEPPKSNVIPDHSEAVLDCRLLPDQDPEEFMDELRKVLDDPRIEFEILSAPGESIISPFNTELFRVIERETKKIYPASITLPHLIIYGTDSRFFRERGAICYGFFPGPVTMEEYGTIHGNDERVREESIRNGIRIYYNVVREFCGK